MTDYKLDNGYILTEEEIEREADMWENDTWEGRLVNLRIGRPPISSEELGSVTFKAPKSRIAAMEKRAKDQGMSKSQFMRMAMEKALA